MSVGKTQIFSLAAIVDPNTHKYQNKVDINWINLTEYIGYIPYTRKHTS